MKPLYEPPHVVHFFKVQSRDGEPRSIFFGTFEMAILPEGRFPICIKEEVYEAAIVYVDADSGHFVANLQFKTVVGCPPRDRVISHILAYQAHAASAEIVEEEV